MHKLRLTRRQFLKLSAVSVLALPSAALARIAAVPPREALAAAQHPMALSMPQPTFNVINSATAFGPPTDIAAGWDGTLWATDASGAPHLYDPVANQWNPFGEGVDAAAQVGSTLYLFHGTQFITVNTATRQASAPVLLATTWPNLPDSFKLGLRGATEANGTLIVFKGGWYVPADGSAPRARLLDLPTWPTTPLWADGLFDSILAGSDTAWLFRGAEFIEVDFRTRRVVSAPKPIATAWKSVIPAQWLSTGFDAGVFDPSQLSYTVFNGPAFSLNAAKPRYIAAAYAAWPASWNPILHHAPSGRAGALWSVAKASAGATSGSVCAYSDDGDTAGWTVFAGTTAASVSTGSDNTTLYVDPNLATSGLFRWNGASWTALGSVPAPLQQVAVGDANHLWVRDGGNNVYSVEPASGVLTLNTQTGTATHMAANADGTLWHCNSASPAVFRLISEAAVPSAATAIKDGLVTSVQKVASTGFGSAHCLTQHTDGSTQIYRYDSPYVFKTAKSYDTGISLAHGLGQLFLTDNTDPAGGVGVALDAHTGVEVARSPLVALSRLTDFVFDPIHDLVYAGFGPLAQGQPGPGGVAAFDARTMKLRWSFATPASVDAKPALSGTQLCFADSATNLYQFNTDAVLNQVAANQPPTPVWTTKFFTGSTPDIIDLIFVGTPLITLGRVYAQVWFFFKTGASLSSLQGFDVADGSSVLVLEGGIQMGIAAADVRGVGPVLGTVNATQAGPTGPTVLHVPAVWVNNGTNIAAAVVPEDVPAGATLTANPLKFTLPAGHVLCGLAWDDGSRLDVGVSSSSPPGTPGVWFGDDLGNLWGLNDSFQLLPYTPFLSVKGVVYSTPVIYKDPQGGATILFSVVDTALPGDAQNVAGFDPDNGLSASVPTGVTSIYALSRDVTNGVVYAGGSTVDPSAISQVFGIRVDGLPQALRDFVIESQMMQDPDEAAPGGSTDPDNPIPPSRARYQTHLTVVDDAKNPQLYEPIKIWADAPTTILVDTVAYDIGPGDTQYAALKTGIDGTLVITTGYSTADGSDAPDIYAAPLRVWAGFMDPYERVVINPDQEFHARVTTAHANAADDDPDKINLVTAHIYTAAPTPLFTGDEQTAGQPSNCAQAIAEMNSGVGFGGATTASALFNILMTRSQGRRQAQRAAHTRRVSASLPKYVAYADIPSMGYFPTNIPAARPASVIKPTGLQFVRLDGQPSTAAAFTALHHTEAQAAIDALPPPTLNPPWEQSQVVNGVRAVRRIENIFTKFWDWLKNAAKTVAVAITHVVVAIADAVTVGIRMLVNGVEKVFKAIVKVVDDIASAVGSFFKMLDKAVEDVVSALSVLFNFGEIMWTHRWLAAQFQARVADLTSGIQTYVQPAIDGVFEGLEDRIKARFDTLRSEFQTQSGNPQISNTKGMGQTPHTAFTVGPKGQPPSSHETSCTWGSQKLKSGTPSATATPPSGQARRADAQADPVADFFTTFSARLTGDGDLADTVTQLKTDFGNLFKVSSAKQFFSTFMVTLLDLVETLILGALVLVNAFVDGILSIINDAIQAVMDILDYEIEIPVLTWLYEKLFNEKLTLLNVATLVAAIPVTIVFRVVEGRYPSQAGLPTTALLHAQSTGQTHAVPPVVKLVFGVFTGVLQLVQGAANCASDAWGEESPPLAGKVSLACGFMILGFTFPLINSEISAVSEDDWALYGIGIAEALIELVVTAKSALTNTLSSVLTCGLGLLNLTLGIIAYVEDGQTNGIANATFADAVIGDIIAILNPIKLAGPEASVVVAAVDVIGGIVLMFISIITAIEANASSAVGAHRLHVPTIHVMPQPYLNLTSQGLP